ncbi:hypothetical protein GCM10027059_49180 [Myceligenerans halotolerans]
MESMRRRAVAKDGRCIDVRLDISTPPSVVRMSLSEPPLDRVYAEVDLWECLKSIRGDLERLGILVCCQGARRNVLPSGVNRQMSDGRLAYLIQAGRTPSDDDLVDIFDPAECADVVTIDEQLLAIRRMFTE